MIRRIRHLLRTTKLRPKLMVAFILTAILPVIIASAFSLTYFFNLTRNSAQANLQDKLHTVELLYHLKEKEIEKLTVSVASDNLVLVNLDLLLYPPIHQHLRQVLAASDLSFLAVLDSEGKLLISGRQAYFRKPEKPILGADILKTVKTEGTKPLTIRLVSEEFLTIEGIAPRPALAIVSLAPILSYDQQPVGFVVGGYIFRAFKNERMHQSLIDEMRANVNAPILLMRENTPLLYSEGNIKQFEFVFPQESQNTEDREHDHYRVDLVTVNKQYYLYSFFPIKAYNGEILAKIGIGLLEDQYRTPRNQAAMLLSLITIVGILIAVEMAYRFSKSISQPVINLMTAMKHVENGDLTVTAAVETQDEIGKLVEAFNTMTARLRENFEEIAKQSDLVKQHEEKYRLLVENAIEAICSVNAEGRFLVMNTAAAQTFGRQPDELIGRTLGEVFPKKVADVMVAGARQVMQSNQGHVMDISWPIRGEVRWFRQSTQPVRDKSGKPTSVLSLSIDITENKRVEEEMRYLRNLLSNIVDSMPSVLIGVDPEGKVTQWNREAEKVTGVTADNAHGHHFTELFPRLAGEMEKVRQAIQSRKPQKDAKIAQKYNGEKRYADVTVYPLISNCVEGAVIRVDDVTDRVRIEEMMIQTEKMLSVGGLAAGMAHEINNPLGVILQGIQNTQRRLSLELKKNQEIAEQCGTDLAKIRAYLERRHIFQYLEGMQDAGLRATKIVTNMLSFSRRSESDMLPTDLNHLLEQTLELASNDYDLKKKYDFRRIDIVRDYDPTLPKVPCMTTEIEQVLLNLLRNAAQAFAEKQAEGYTPQIRLQTRKERGYATIVIADNGPGMDEEIRTHIFEPFYTTKPVGKGTGLGLSVSYFIITAHHNGTISVHSEPGKGTQFRIRLPLPPERGKQ